MLKIKNLNEVQKEGNATLNLLLYGESGVGKTYLASSSAELGKVLYCDAESGAKFIPERFSENIDILKLDNINDLDEVLKPENINEYKTIVLDSITEIMKKMLDKIKGTKEKPSIGDWGLVIDKMETYFRRFRDLEKNIIMVALCQEKGDEDILVKRPSLSGKNLPADIVGIVDICLYIENGQGGRVAYTQPTLKYYAKDRTSKLPDKITQENLSIKWISEQVIKKVEMASKEDLAFIKDAIVKLNFSKEIINKMFAFAGCDKLENMNVKQAEKLIKALKVKLSE